MDGGDCLGRLELRGVEKVYPGGIAAARGVDLIVEDGELFVLLGPSGSGKSTILRLISGLESADLGTIWVDERRIDRLPPRDRGVAMVFQDQALYPHLDVFENIAFGLRARKRPEAEVDRAVRETADALSLAGCLDRPPATLSGGQRRRVALARAMVTRPRLFLLDEPFSGLDAPLRAATRRELIDLRRKLGATMILVTHDQGEAMAIADRLAVIDGGRVVQVGRPLDVYRDPSTRFVARFVGQPPMSFLPCHASLEAGRVRIRVDGLSDQGPWAVAPSGAPGAALTAGVEVRIDLGVRPEDVSIVGPGPADRAGESPILAAVVASVEAAGSEVVARLSVGPHELAIRLPSTSTVRPGSAVEVALDLDRACWFEAATGHRLSGGAPRVDRFVKLDDRNM